MEKYPRNDVEGRAIENEQSPEKLAGEVVELVANNTALKILISIAERAGQEAANDIIH